MTDIQNGSKNGKKKVGCVRMLAIMGGIVLVFGVFATLCNPSPSPTPPPPEELVSIDYVVHIWGGPCKVNIWQRSASGDLENNELMAPPGNSEYKVSYEFEVGDLVYIEAEALNGSEVAISCAILTNSGNKAHKDIAYDIASVNDDAKKVECRAEAK